MIRGPKPICRHPLDFTVAITLTDVLANASTPYRKTNTIFLFMVQPYTSSFGDPPPHT